MREILVPERYFGELFFRERDLHQRDISLWRAILERGRYEKDTVILEIYFRERDTQERYFRDLF